MLVFNKALHGTVPYQPRKSRCQNPWDFFGSPKSLRTSDISCNHMQPSLTVRFRVAFCTNLVSFLRSCSLTPKIHSHRPGTCQMIVTIQGFYTWMLLLRLWLPRECMTDRRSIDSAATYDAGYWQPWPSENCSCIRIRFDSTAERRSGLPSCSVNLFFSPSSLVGVSHAPFLDRAPSPRFSYIWSHLMAQSPSSSSAFAL